MAKQSFTLASWATTTIRQLPVRIKGQATTVQTSFDKASEDILNFTNTHLIAELSSGDGANRIGFSDPGFASDNVGDGLVELKTELGNVVTGQIPDGTITEPKLDTGLADKINGKANLVGGNAFTGNQTVETINNRPIQTSLTDTTTNALIGVGSFGVTHWALQGNAITGSANNLPRGTVCLCDTTTMAGLPPLAGLYIVSTYGNANLTGTLWQTALHGATSNMYARTVGITDWRPVAFAEAPTVTTITSGFASGWSGSIVTRKSGNTVQVAINLTKNTDVSVSELLYTLPIGLRPSDLMIPPLTLWDSGATASIAGNSSYMLLSTNGELTLSQNTGSTTLNARRVFYFVISYIVA